MNASAHIVDIDESNAQQLLIEESMTRPVVVDFWADWCEPCKQLMPILEKLVTEYQGAFLLAKVNADEQQMLAQQLGVRSLPTVMVIKDGQPIDGFSGAQTESAVREMLDKHLPSPQAGALAEAEQLLADGDIPGALALFRSAWEESGQKSDMTLAYAGALVTANRLDDAESLLKGIRLADQDARYEQLMAQIELGREAARSPEMEACTCFLTNLTTRPSSTGAGWQAFVAQFPFIDTTMQDTSPSWHVLRTSHVHSSSRTRSFRWTATLRHSTNFQARCTVRLGVHEASQWQTKRTRRSATEPAEKDLRHTVLRIFAWARCPRRWVRTEDS